MNKYPSANSSLPLEDLEKLKECIEKANEILRTLGNPLNPNNMESLRLFLRKLKGFNIKVVLTCNNKKKEFTGTLQEAGRDFLSLATSGEKIFILYRRICSLTHVEKAMEKMEPELLNIDDGLRRAIILNFGEVVSKSPNLINLFFGIPLYLQLQFILGATLRVIKKDSTTITGSLIKSEKEQITIKSKQQTFNINIDDICFIQLSE